MTIPNGHTCESQHAGVDQSCGAPVEARVRCSEMRHPIALAASGRQRIARDACVYLCAACAGVTRDGALK